VYGHRSEKRTIPIEDVLQSTGRRGRPFVSLNQTFTRLARKVAGGVSRRLQLAGTGCQSALHCVTYG
jgi:hypothetical protein